MINEMRKFIDAVTKSDTLLSISSFGENFEACGVLIRHSGEGQPTHYVVEPEAKISKDLSEKFSAKTGEELINLLVKHKILKQLPGK